MTLSECYAAMGGDYALVFGRLRSDRLIQKFVLKFPEDKSYDLLLTSMEENNDEEAFRAAHTIKGVCQNLGFTRLLESSSKMSDALRHGRTPEADGLLEKLKADYKVTMDAILEFKKECGEA